MPPPVAKKSSGLDSPCSVKLAKRPATASWYVFNAFVWQMRSPQTVYAQVESTDGRERSAAQGKRCESSFVLTV